MSDTPKGPGGRPTDYKPDFHPQEVLRMGQQGYHVYEMASEFRITKSTLYEWAKHHTEFSNAFDLAREDSKAFVMKTYRRNLENGNFNPKVVTTYAKFILDMQDVNRDQYVKIKGYNDSDKPVDRLKATHRALGNGEITSKQAQEVINSIDTSVKCETNQSDVAELITQLKDEINKHR